MPDPYSQPEDLPPSARQDTGYSPLRTELPEEPTYGIPQEDVGSKIKQFQDWQEALRLQQEDFSMELPESDYVPSEPTDDYQAPQTWDEAENAIRVASTQLDAREAELAQYIEDTRSITPFGKESTQEVLKRGKLIAQARREHKRIRENVAAAQSQIAQARLAQQEDPAWWQETLGVVADGLGAMAPVLNFLGGPQEILAGGASFVSQGIAAMTGEKTQFTEMTAEDYADIPLAMFDSDSVIRQRGRQMNRLVGEYTAETYLGPTLPMNVTAKLLEAVGGPNSKWMDDFRPIANQITFEVMTDPLNLLEGAGSLTRLGKLREVAKVNAGAMETAATLKTLREVPELAELLKATPDAVFQTARQGTLVTDLRKAGVDGERAASLAKKFDAAWAANAADLRNLATSDRARWAVLVGEYLDEAPKSVNVAEQRKAVSRISEFGDDVDPIIGRTFQEQAILGQRLRAWKPIIDRFGNNKWFKRGMMPVAILTGTSLKHDIAHNPELLELYYAQRLFKGNAGAEFMAYQQDVTARAAALLRGFDDAQKAAITERAAPIIEYLSPLQREMARKGTINADNPLDRVVYDFADLYDEQAETLRAMQNRFNLDVADLTGELGYFGREFSDELKAWLLENKKAREYLFADSTARSREFLTTALLPEERARVLKDMDFSQSEDVLRAKFAQYGLPENIPVWSRDSFGNLSKRAERAQHQAELRNFYSAFVEISGNAPAGKVEAVRAGVKAMLADKGDDVAEWSNKAKAQWLLGQPEFKPTGLNESALDVLVKAKVALPSEWDELARLAAMEITPTQAKEFQRLAKGMYWSHLDSPGKFGKVYDAVKGIYQRSTLARVASLTKDLWGTTVNLLMEGEAIKYSGQALKELGGFEKWRKGGGSALVNRLRAQGILRTTKAEALDQIGALESIIPGKVGRGLGRIEAKGVVGGMLENVEAAAIRAGKLVGLDLKKGKAATKVSENLSRLNDARVYWEEMGRVATYLKTQAKGYSDAEAAEEVFKWWGKFDELSGLERNVLNRIMFFWSWMARSIPITVRHLLTHPARSRWLLTAMAGDVHDNENMPAWLRRTGGWALGRNAKGNIDAINVGGSTYFSPTFAALQGNFANAAMQGKPMAAAQGAALDLARSSPPFVQAGVEFAMKTDLFTMKPWWRDRNAETGSNAKAPQALAWFAGTPIGDLLGLQEVTAKGDSAAKYYTMAPEWAWFFGAMPGVEPAIADVSAFFSSPEDARGVPKLTLGRGLARQAGFPIYDVPLDDGKRQLYEFRNALAKQADKGDALIMVGGKLVPSNTTWRGQAMRNWIDQREAHHRRQGMSAADAADAALDDTQRSEYADDGKLMLLQKRLERWERHIIAIGDGKSELQESEKARIALIARQADYSRVDRDRREQERKRLAKLGLKPVK